MCLIKGGKQGDLNRNGLNKGREEEGSSCNGPAVSDSVLGGFCIEDVEHGAKGKISAQFQQLFCTF